MSRWRGPRVGCRSRLLNWRRWKRRRGCRCCRICLLWGRRLIVRLRGALVLVSYKSGVGMRGDAPRLAAARAEARNNFILLLQLCYCNMQIVMFLNWYLEEGATSTLNRSIDRLYYQPPRYRSCRTCDAPRPGAYGSASTIA